MALYRMTAIVLYFSLFCTACIADTKKTLRKSYGRIFITREEKRQLEPHEHVYDHCLCVCGDVEYLDKDDKAVILSSSDAEQIPVSDSGHVNIPDTITRDGKEYEVAGLGTACFKDRQDVVSVTMPDTVRYLGWWCFDSCSRLQTVKLSNSIQVIGMAAFQLCSSLSEMELPDSVRIIENFAYNHCSGAQNSSLYLPASLIRMGTDRNAPTHMFYDCGTSIFTEFEVDENNPAYKDIDGVLYTKDGTVLVSIPRGKIFDDATYVMPDAVEWLGELSFSRNQNIRTVVLSDNLVVDAIQTTEQRSVFTNRGNDLSNACYGYSSVSVYEVKQTNPRYLSNEGVRYSKDGSVLIAIPLQYTGVLTVPEGVRVWAEEALCRDIDYFKDIAIDKITEIRIPSTLEEIPEEQVEAVNLLADMYGTKITVSESNPWFTVSEGHLAVK